MCCFMSINIYMRLYCTVLLFCYLFFFFFNDTATTEIYTLSLHDALPISQAEQGVDLVLGVRRVLPRAESEPEAVRRSEEHTSELQSHSDLVCRLLLEKKKKKKKIIIKTIKHTK